MKNKKKKQIILIYNNNNKDKILIKKNGINLQISYNNRLFNINNRKKKIPFINKIINKKKKKL